ADRGGVVCDEREAAPPGVVVEEDRNPAGPARADVKDPFVGHRVARQPCHGSKVIRSYVSSGACGTNVTLSSRHHPSNQATAWDCPEPWLLRGGAVGLGAGVQSWRDSRAPAREALPRPAGCWRRRARASSLRAPCSITPR